MKTFNAIQALIISTALAVSSTSFAVYSSKNPQPQQPSATNGSTSHHSSSDGNSSKDSSPAAQENPKPPAGPSVVTVTPEYLRQRILGSNLDLEVELNTVKDQKDRLNLARTNLLPSINLAVGAGISANFLISAVQYLLPFLVPSNWFQLDAQEHVFDAEKVSYRILELNVYSSALSMYYAILADNKVMVAYQQEADDYMNIYNEKKQFNDLFGVVPPQDLENFLANAELAKTNASQLIELSAQEIASLRQVLALPLTTQINLQANDEPASEWEAKPVTAAVQQALIVAPEYQQIKDLSDAAVAGEWSAGFGFINTGTAVPAASTNGGSIPNFGGVTGSLSFHFGLDYFPTLALSDRNVDEIRLRLAQLVQETSQTVESSLNSTIQASSQYQFATDAQKQITAAYSIVDANYKAGVGTLLDVIQAHTTLTTASITLARAEEDLNNQRVTLERALILGQFAQIKGCKVEQESALGVIEGLFGAGTNLQIDQICRENGNNLDNLRKNN